MRLVINTLFYPNTRVVMGEFRPGVLRVGIERGEFRVEITEGHYSPGRVPSELG